MKKERTLTEPDIGLHYPPVPSTSDLMIYSKWNVNARKTHYYVNSYVDFDTLILGAESRYNTALAGSNKGTVTKTAIYPPSAEVFTSTEEKRPKYNNCTHLKHTRINKSFGYYTDWGERYRYVKPFWRLTFPTPFAFSDSDVAHAGLGTLNAARSRAWWEMQPRFQGEVSMLNFLFELKDFRDIMKFATNFRYAEISKHLRHADDYLKRGTFDPTLPAAQHRLINEFAIKPLLSDWKRICEQALNSVVAVQEDFYQDGLDVQKSHYSEYLAEVESLSSIESDYYGTDIKLGYRTRTKFTATLEYTYKYTMRDLHHAFVRYWGLSGSFEAFWNAIPFSFLVDYFAKIGQALHAMETDPNVKTREIQYCESLLTTHEVGKFLVGSSATHTHVDLEEVNMGSTPFITGGLSSNYTRYVCNPRKGLYVPKVSLPNSKQGLNMLALARTFLSSRRLN